MTFRVFTNKPGSEYDAEKTAVLYAEDLNDIVDAIEALGTPPVKATGAELNTGTDDAKFATAKALADSDYAKTSDIPSVPVKASGAEIDTGTDDAKFATPKAILDSKLINEDGTHTLTNKRITPRITTISSHATPTINTDNCDCVTITAQAEAISSMTTNLSGTPTNFQKLIIRIKDNGTARAITWGASFEAKGVALPTTTILSKVLTVGFIYDTVTSKWGCVASAQEV